jgi:hypothetical protein
MLRPVCHLLEVLAGTGGEERDLMKVIDECIWASHSDNLSGSMRLLNVLVGRKFADDDVVPQPGCPMVVPEVCTA